MAVRIGKVELPGVQDLYTEESRTLVEQRVPEQQGSVFQDLGREPLTLVLEGLLFGEDALTGLEELRQAQSKAKPLPFAADIAVGAELTDVIIEDLRIRQVAGYQHRYRFTLRLREYKAPPQPAAALAPVDTGILADADAWGAGALAAVSVLQDPTSLPAVLAAQPDLLNHLSATDLGNSLVQNAADLTGTDFSKIMQAVKSVDPQMVVDLIQTVRDGGGLGDFLNKYASEGLDLLSDLSGIDLSKAGSLVRALAGGFEFLKTLKEVADATGTLLDDFKKFDPLAPLRPIF